MASRVDNSTDTVQQSTNVANALRQAIYDNAAFEDINNDENKAETSK